MGEKHVLFCLYFFKCKFKGHQAGEKIWPPSFFLAGREHIHTLPFEIHDELFSAAEDEKTNFSTSFNRKTKLYFSWDSRVEYIGAFHQDFATAAMAGVKFE